MAPLSPEVIATRRLRVVSQARPLIVAVAPVAPTSVAAPLVVLKRYRLPSPATP
jgi:hypothetical protein